jgi:hypothetical protein
MTIKATSFMLGLEEEFFLAGRWALNRSISSRNR